MRGIVKRIIGVVLFVVSFIPLPGPLNDINVKISLILSGISFLGYEIFFIRRNIVTLIMFFASVSSIVPINLPIKIILFIISLDLISFPVVPSIPIIDLSRIAGRIFLAITFIGLSFIGLDNLGIDVNMIIIFVVLLTVGEIAFKVISFGLIPWKAIIIFFIALIWVFNWNWMFALIPAVGEFVLDHIL